MSKDTTFIVAIHGYEGTEDMFGPLPRGEAIDLTCKLKIEAPKQKNPDPLDEHDDFYRRLRIAESLGAWTVFKADQVCLMGRHYKTNKATCMCRLLRKEVRNKEIWLH